MWKLTVNSNRPRTAPGKYDNVLCIHSASGEGNKSTFNPNPLPRQHNFSFVGDGVRSCWPESMEDFDIRRGNKVLSGTSIATPIAVATAVFMITYVRRKIPGYIWEREPSSHNGVRAIFDLMLEERDGYHWVSLPLYFRSKSEDQIRADLIRTLGGRLRQNSAAAHIDS